MLSESLELSETKTNTFSGRNFDSEGYDGSHVAFVCWTDSELFVK